MTLKYLLPLRTSLLLQETPCILKITNSAILRTKCAGHLRTKFAMETRYHFPQFIDKFLRFEIYNGMCHLLCLNYEQPFPIHP